MTITRVSMLKPGLFGTAVAADARRGEFDFGNESLLTEGVRPDVLFIGDSITHLWEVQAYFAGGGRVLVNRGIGGDTSAFVRKRFAADALQLRPRLVVMKIGTNDLGWSEEALDDAISDKICEHIAAMLADARDAGVPMALCSILPIWGPSWYPSAAFTARKNAQIVALNARLRPLAAGTGAIYVDYHPHMTDADGTLLRDLADDGVHPHAAGYALMARVLRETLAAHGHTV
jgi:lysophospholipase L1-like esterase